MFLISREETFHEIFSSPSRRKWDRRVSSYFSLAPPYSDYIPLHGGRTKRRCCRSLTRRPTISRQRDGRATATIVSRHNRASSDRCASYPALPLSLSLSLSLAGNESTLEDSATFVRRRRRRDTSQILIALCLTFDTRRVATDFSLTFLLFVSTL